MENDYIWQLVNEPIALLIGASSNQNRRNIMLCDFDFQIVMQRNLPKVVNLCDVWSDERVNLRYELGDTGFRIGGNFRLMSMCPGYSLFTDIHHHRQENQRVQYDQEHFKQICKYETVVMVKSKDLFME